MMKGEEKMRREIIKKFILWFCLIMIPGVLFFHYYLKLPLDMELFRLIILASFACLNFIYLFLKLDKTYPIASIIFGVVFWFAGFIYLQVCKDIDVLTQFIHIIIALVSITIIVHFIQRKFPSH